MIKETAKALMALWGLWAVNHGPKCLCGGTAKGAAQEHGGKTESEFNRTLALAIS